MRAHRFLAAVTSIAGAALAQTTSEDVGLTLGGPSINTPIGQICGPVPCQPLPGGGITRGATYYLTQNAAAFSPYAMAIGTPTSTCMQIPGIANGLLLGTPTTIFAAGVTGPPVPVFLCPRGVDTVQFVIPTSVPAGIGFHLQSVGVSWSGELAFSPAIAAVTQ
ncbi:MAG TPA: hypothetical protein VFZ65_12160 [Planctomycetota bacterium]|nr:hypothetical protein [Planctomycetota bacterium]